MAGGVAVMQPHYFRGVTNHLARQHGGATFSLPENDRYGFGRK
jgi:hypothetical protein